MKRVLWAGLALLPLVSSQAWTTPNQAASEDSDHASPVSAYFIAPFLTPWLVAFDMRRDGFADYPYSQHGGYGNGDRPFAFEAGEATEFTGGGRAAQHFDLRLRGSRGLGLDASTSSYGRGSFGAIGTSGFYRSNFTANYVQSETSLLEFGMGVGMFQAPQSSWGPSWDLNYEFFPKAPWSFRARYEVALIGGRGYHEFTLGAAASWRRFSLGAGFRSLLNPLRNTGGPELTAQIFL